MAHPVQIGADSKAPGRRGSTGGEGVPIGSYSPLFSPMLASATPPSSFNLGYHHPSPLPSFQLQHHVQFQQKLQQLQEDQQRQLSSEPSASAPSNGFGRRHSSSFFESASILMPGNVISPTSPNSMYAARLADEQRIYSQSFHGHARGPQMLSSSLSSSYSSLSSSFSNSAQPPTSEPVEDEQLVNDLSQMLDDDDGFEEDSFSPGKSSSSKNNVDDGFFPHEEFDGLPSSQSSQQQPIVQKQSQHTISAAAQASSRRPQAASPASPLSPSRTAAVSANGKRTIAPNSSQPSSSPIPPILGSPSKQVPLGISPVQIKGVPRKSGDGPSSASSSIASPALSGSPSTSQHYHRSHRSSHYGDSGNEKYAWVKKEPNNNNPASASSSSPSSPDKPPKTQQQQQQLPVASSGLTSSLKAASINGHSQGSSSAPIQPAASSKVNANASVASPSSASSSSSPSVTATPSPVLSPALSPSQPAVSSPALHPSASSSSSAASPASAQMFPVKTHPSIPITICKYYMSGGCRIGNACRYSHDILPRDHVSSSSSSSSSVPQQQQQQQQQQQPSGHHIPVACKYFQQGYCSKADKCPFLHEKYQPRSAAAPSVPAKVEVEIVKQAIVQHGVSFSEKAAAKKAQAAQAASSSAPPQPISVSAVAPAIVSPSPPPVVVPSARASSSSSSSGPRVEKPVCPFYMQGDCRYGDYCRLAHIGEACPTCGKPILNPNDPAARAEHLKDCGDRREVVMDREHSLDLECGICMSNIVAESARFGVLTGCDHHFCLSCIREWRGKQDQSTEAVRGCPLCRCVSYYIIPSQYFPRGAQRKDVLVRSYKAKLQLIPCKLFDFGRNVCPFGNSCFYAHVDQQGNTLNSGPRIRLSSEGEASLVKGVLLSDFIFKSRDEY